MLDFPLGWRYETVVVWGDCEVEYLGPLIYFLLCNTVVVDKVAEEVRLERVRVHHAVFEIIWSKLESGRAFNDWVVWRVQIELCVKQLPTPELRTSNCEFAVFRIADEYRCLDGSNIKCAILDAVALDLRGVI